jgi:glycosyltransferase involved in cell wall biosynthesis
MSGLKLLTICHNHPRLHPGGTEIFAHDLHQEWRRRRSVEPLFVGCTNQLYREPRPGTSFQTLGSSADELVLWAGHFDRFHQSPFDLYGVIPDLAELLQNFRPDIVHFHHTLLVGVEALFLVRRMLPEARIVFTLHDYYPICPRDGIMLTTTENRPCHGATLDGCRRCFPAVPPERFVMREQYIKTAFSLVDMFVAPSRFLRQRFIEWGLPAERIKVIANGRPAVEPAAHRALAPGGRRSVFGYFGNVTPAKGATIAVKAAGLLRDADDDGISLRVHGGSPFQTEGFVADFAEAVATAGDRVIHLGPYTGDQMAGLMAAVDWVVVPSIWWENAPLVIQEAFQHRRPVICSDIGGMAEMVGHGVNGLHFRRGDATDLARVMRRAATEDGLWDQLLAGIPQIPTIGAVAVRYRRLYQRLLERGAAASADSAVVEDAA